MVSVQLMMSNAWKQGREKCRWAQANHAFETEASDISAYEAEKRSQHPTISQDPRQLPQQARGTHPWPNNLPTEEFRKDYSDTEPNQLYCAWSR